MRNVMQIAKPVRVRHTYTQRLDAPPERVFPLLCPVREVDWVEGWHPLAVYSTSGVAEPECVFVMPADQAEAIWVITRHDPEAYVVEFVKVTPGHTVGRIGIRLEAAGAGATNAEVTYAYTALSEQGIAFVESFTEDAYNAFMQEWEDALNHYLRTGAMLTGDQPASDDASA